MSRFLKRNGAAPLAAVVAVCLALALPPPKADSTTGSKPGESPDSSGGLVAADSYEPPLLLRIAGVEHGRDSPAATANAAPLAATAADIVLSPADVGPDFVVASSGEAIRFGVSARVQSLVRAGKQIQNIEPDGILYVRSFAQVTGDSGTADQLFEQFTRGLLESGFIEVEAPSIGERSRAAIAWGQGPFDPAMRVIVFRLQAALGWVVVASYDAPDQIDEVVSLAQKMAVKAAR